MRKIVYFLFSLTTGCITTDWPNLDDKIKTWKGANEDDVIVTWGAPDKMFESSSGLKVLTYTSTSIHANSNVNYTPPKEEIKYAGSHTIINGGSYSLSCKVDFVIKGSEVLKASYQGEWSECISFVKMRY